MPVTSTLYTQGEFAASTKSSNAARCYKEGPTVLPFLCFFASLSLFFLSIDIRIALERLDIYTMPLNDECTVALSFSPSCPSLFHHGQQLPFAS
jgi:hypothetical protein